MTISPIHTLTFLLLVATSYVDATQLRSLQPRIGKTKKHGALFRRLLQGGHVFVVSSKVMDGTEWCMDAVEGTWVGEDGQYPSLGLRPCAFLAGPSEQLFNPSNYGGGDIGDTLVSSFNGYFCMVLQSTGSPKEGDRVRLGQCDDDDEDGDFSYDITVNDRQGQITVASNPNLCVTFEGHTPDDEDRLVLAKCEDDDDKFQWSFRSGWYILGSYGCVRVRDNVLSVGNRIVTDDCSSAGFGGHWRLDANGLFHSRLDDSFCMRATAPSKGAAIRLAKCDPADRNQLWLWPDGFEAPITLMGTDFNLVHQGETEENGDIMILGTTDYEFSGDPVHI